VKYLGLGILAWLAVLVIVAGTATFAVALGNQLLPWQQNVERKVTTHSRQYVQANQEQLLALAQDVRRLEATPSENSQAQIIATVNRMEVMAALLPEGTVPPSVTAILIQYGR
jgi:hypothetical protein